jgi:hypothetical protein
MKTAIKHENDEFLVISLKHVSGVKVVVNRPGTPKLWAVAHENGHKTRKLRVFSHIYQNFNGSYRPCKSNSNPKTMVITHENGHKHENDELFGITLNPVLGLKVVVNRLGTPKQLAIAHENGHKT